MKKTITLTLIALLVLATIGTVIAISPEKPDTITYMTNRTASYPNGTKLNRSRGAIHVISITHSQPTLKWVGYIGNITGTIALKDANANRLFDWTMGTNTGEVYATKEIGCSTGGGDNQGNIFCGGIPIWTSLVCANMSIIRNESGLYNHTWSDGDSYINTFKAWANFTVKPFYAGEKYIDNNVVAVGGTTCPGLYLNINNTHQYVAATTRKWQEVVLTDGTTETENHFGPARQYDVLYAALIENKTYGYDRSRYDFQMLLPQSGLSGSQNNVAYYFYVELV